MNGGRKTVDSLEQADKIKGKGRLDSEFSKISEVDMKLKVFNLIRHYLQKKK